MFLFLLLQYPNTQGDTYIILSTMLEEVTGKDYYPTDDPDHLPEGHHLNGTIISKDLSRYLALPGKVSDVNISSLYVSAKR